MVKDAPVWWWWWWWALKMTMMMTMFNDEIRADEARGCQYTAGGTTGTAQGNRTVPPPRPRCHPPLVVGSVTLGSLGLWPAVPHPRRCRLPRQPLIYLSQPTILDPQHGTCGGSRESSTPSMTRRRPRTPHLTTPHPRRGPVRQVTQVDGDREQVQGQGPLWRWVVMLAHLQKQPGNWWPCR